MTDLDPAPISLDAVDERLRAALPSLEAYLSSILVDEDHPACVFDWQEDNVKALVAVANDLEPASAPVWFRTKPPNMTPDSLIDDCMAKLEEWAGGRFGQVALAPNSYLVQYVHVVIMLNQLEQAAFLQHAAEVALPLADDGTERYLAVTYKLSDADIRHAQQRQAPATENERGVRMRQLFY